LAYQYEYKYLGYNEGRRKININLMENFFFDLNIEFDKILNVYEEYSTEMKEMDFRIIRVEYSNGNMGKSFITFDYDEVMEYMKRENEYAIN
jgi:hypothetical protein